MIRDPSDGSVKPPPIKRPLIDTRLPKPETASEKELKRLERDREWLRDWKAKQESGK